MLVLLHGGVKYDEKFSCVCLRSGEKQNFPESATLFFSLTEMWFLFVSVISREKGLV
jgi:hypothetical protein